MHVRYENAVRARGLTLTKTHTNIHLHTHTESDITTHTYTYTHPTHTYTPTHIHTPTHTHTHIRTHRYTRHTQAQQRATYPPQADRQHRAARLSQNSNSRRWRSLAIVRSVICMSHVYTRTQPVGTGDTQITATRGTGDTHIIDRTLSALCAMRVLYTRNPPSLKLCPRRIVNNVQLALRNMHVRYEDATNSTAAFAIGATMAELSIFSANSGGERSFNRYTDSRATT